MDVRYPESVTREHALTEHRDELMREVEQLREAVKDALNLLSRPHSRDEFVMTYNRKQISSLLDRLQIAKTNGANMAMLPREKATAPGFVWIPTGHSFGKPHGIVGKWHGEYDEKGNAKVEFKAGIVSVNSNAIFVATEQEINEDAI